jgi:hypothetical protein
MFGPNRDRPAGKQADWFNCQWALILLMLVILTAAAIRIRLLQVPLERDEGEYAYAGQLILQGVPPYKLAYNMKLPGTYLGHARVAAVRHLPAPVRHGKHLYIRAHEEISVRTAHAGGDDPGNRGVSFGLCDLGEGAHILDRVSLLREVDFRLGGHYLSANYAIVGQLMLVGPEQTRFFWDAAAASVPLGATTMVLVLRRRDFVGG